MPSITYEQHVRGWQNCRRCPLHLIRTRVVLCRGTLPCNVLFIGIGPGQSEDTIGQPFKGPAGRHLQEHIIDKAIPPNITYALTNLVACLPMKESEEHKPDKEAIKACAERLEELISIAQPKLIVLLGKFVESHYKTKLPNITMVHPSYLLQIDNAAKWIETRSCVNKLREAVVRSLLSAEVPHALSGHELDDVKIAVNVDDLNRVLFSNDMAVAKMLHGNLDQSENPVRIGPKEAAVVLTCDTMTAACICDSIRDAHVKLNDPFRVYIRQNGKWRKVVAGKPLSVVSGDRVILNRDLFKFAPTEFEGKDFENI